MNKESITFIKNNAVGIGSRIFSIIICLVITFTLLDMWSKSVSNVSYEFNMFVTVSTWGAIIVFWLIEIVIFKWFDYFLPLKETKNEK